MTGTRTRALYEKAKTLIPGGTQLLSKRPERYHEGLWPAHFSRAKGCEIWDLDGNHFVDMGPMGIGSCILGYADADVDGAVKAVIDQGMMSSLNPPEEVELAELLCTIHPWADMARFARSGGEAAAIAIRIARARSGKDTVLFCGYHGWHDWYLASNLADESALDGHLLPGLVPRGVPRALAGSAIPFRYNDTDEFLRVWRQHESTIGAVIMEPIRSHHPAAGFLETIREVTAKAGTVLIYDEITSGWRLTVGGAHLTFGVEPDIAVMGKGMSNGYPMSAVIGRGDVMSCAADLFISSTFWTDRIGPVAALATIQKLTQQNVPPKLAIAGNAVQAAWSASAKKHGVHIHVHGTPALSHFGFDAPNPQLMKTLFIQYMLEHEFLASTAHYASFAHTEPHVRAYAVAADAAMAFVAEAAASGRPESFLRGTVAASDFARLA